MKKIKFLIAGFAALLSASSLSAQNKENPWLIGVGMHAVDYTSVRGVFDKYFQTKNWSFTPPLSKLWVSRALGNSFAIEAAATVGEIPNKRYDLSDRFFLNAGLGFKYKLANGYVFPASSRLDPYLRLGVNYVKNDMSGEDLKFEIKDGPDKKLGPVYRTRATQYLGLSGGVGFNVWITKTFGLNLQSDYNWMPSAQRDVADFFQHSAGVVFRFGKKAAPVLPPPAPVVVEPEPIPVVEEPVVLDTDGDGIPDNEDQCPTVPGPRENNGCPWDEAKEVEDLNLSFKSILFNYNKATIRPESRDVVSNAARVMTTKLTNAKFYVDGHTDKKGSAAYNKKLSKERAQAVVHALVAEGVDADRLRARGFGSEYAQVPASASNEAREADRKVQLVKAEDNFAGFVQQEAATIAPVSKGKKKPAVKGRGTVRGKGKGAVKGKGKATTVKGKGAAKPVGKKPVTRKPLGKKKK